MKFLTHSALWALVLLFMVSGCKNTTKPADVTLAEGVRVVDVINVEQAQNYTYFEVMEDDSKFWIAGTKREAKQGDRLYFSDFMEMTDFRSEDLNRTFESILFVQDLSDKPITDREKKVAEMGGGKPSFGKAEVNVVVPEGAVSLAELFRNRLNYDQKTIKVRGVVVKFSPDIMKRNWVHIQDGTEADGNYDLTITTMDSVTEGDEVTFEGTVTLSKDFGAGYRYDVILEEAKATDVKKGALPQTNI